ncbi:MAG: NADH-quinone oxidoreductase subunit NuoK [Proteobacteria bacterium]|nr:NADH-quinone oxidoreductase subunit NuoK [Pseudomonadota bacterium]
MVPTTQVLALAALLFCIGLAGVIVRRNLLIVMMSVELMLNGANLALVAFARARGDLEGQALAFLIVALAAAEAAVGLAIVVSVFRSRRTVYADEVNLLRR